MKRIFFSAFLFFSIVLLSQPSPAAELSGRVFSKGAPVANLTVAVKGTETKTKTGPKGEYKLDLPPGNHTLIIRGEEFPVKVESDKTSHDIQL
ncbi:carboxypeptidase regulatory-like domain-containing protein [Candidatus Manganitrophus noduliformans]|uniref:Carboxypeptidase-like regulatory domain-containing protein n=1 Tax=Candidatus Manganitrophus noduliformans TaxID=2606439 RepID=A0A7X6DLS6_9BACT|nr:carboxypeptidase regulatory-like domain-containing protein [Candidatus Manganitrophus noduliformans]NKE69457.1 carboxypeptidase-like regulatory domain-containing protein [Candidatus Manganitrophus noduliformans]